MGRSHVRHAYPRRANKTQEASSLPEQQRVARRMRERPVTFMQFIYGGRLSLREGGANG